MTAKKMGTYCYNIEILKQGLRLIALFTLNTLLARIIHIVAVNVRGFPQYPIIFVWVTFVSFLTMYYSANHRISFLKVYLKKCEAVEERKHQCDSFFSRQTPDTTSPISTTS